MEQEQKPLTTGVITQWPDLCGCCQQCVPSCKFDVGVVGGWGCFALFCVILFCCVIARVPSACENFCEIPDNSHPFPGLCSFFCVPCFAAQVGSHAGWNPNWFAAPPLKTKQNKAKQSKTEQNRAKQKQSGCTCSTPYRNTTPKKYCTHTNRGG